MKYTVCSIHAYCIVHVTTLLPARPMSAEQRWWINYQTRLSSGSRDYRRMAFRAATSNNFFFLFMHFYFVEGCVFLFTFLSHFDFYFHSSLPALLVCRKQCQFDLDVFLKLPSLQQSIGMTRLFHTRSNVHVPYAHENVRSEWNFRF